MTPPDSAVLEYATPTASSRFRWLDTLGWAAYLGVSWTWCIGMFFPVLLIRDYGVAGWLAFAIPNVVGAAAMGWVVRSRGHSEQLVWAHRPAIRLFSIVTVSFHVFFIRWIMSELGSETNIPRWAVHAGSDLATLFWPAALIAPFLLIYLIFKQRGDRFATGIALLVSITLALIGVKVGLFPFFDPMGFRVTIPLGPDADGALNLAYLTPIMIFGFLLCPYLDQTFHRARQKSRQPRSAFVLGFGVFFFAMIVMTLGYSVWLHDLSGISELLFWMAPMAGILLWVHLMIQSGITMELHLRDATRPDGRELTPASIISLVLAYAGGTYASLASANGEGTYRIFMGFYALIFPAYVLICMQPWRKVTAAPCLRQWVFFAGAVILAGPFFLMGITGENRLPMFCGLLVVLVMATAERVLPAIAMRKSGH
jgi:hypothetical protein